MKAGKIFNEEKVLYFASQEQSFHVQPDEPRDSDCRRIVDSLVARGCMVRVSAGASGEFYGTTPKGEARLLELQIQWRQSHGKDVAEQQQKLAELQQGEMA